MLKIRKHNDVLFSIKLFLNIMTPQKGGILGPFSKKVRIGLMFKRLGNVRKVWPAGL